MPSSQPYLGAFPSRFTLSSLRHWFPAILFSLLMNFLIFQVFVLVVTWQKKIVEQPEIVLAVRIVESQNSDPLPQVLPEKPTPIPKPQIKPKPVPQPVEPADIPEPKTVVEEPRLAPQPEPQPQTTEVENVEPHIEVTTTAETDVMEHEPIDPKPREEIIPQPLFRLTRNPDYSVVDLREYYPKEELAFNNEAIVEVSVLLDKNGEVHEFKILKSAGARFDAAATQALLDKKIIFRPGYIDGEPVAVRVRIPIEFRIE